MDKKSLNEAQDVSNAVVNDLVKTVINDRSIDSSDEEDPGVSESLSTVLESLTEESAKEIFAEVDKPVLSENTSKIIATFLGKSPVKNKPVDVQEDFSSDDEEGTLVIVEPFDKKSSRSAKNKNVKNLDEITFSDNSSEDRTSLNISWEAIESRPSSSAAAPPPHQQQNLPKKKADYEMKEVIDEFVALEDESMSSSGAEGVVKTRGRRVKSKPRKKKVITAKSQASLDEEDSEKLAEDVDQIVAFIREENALEEKHQEKIPPLVLGKKAVDSPPHPPPSQKKRKGARGGRKRKKTLAKSGQKKPVKQPTSHENVPEEAIATKEVSATAAAEKKVFKPIQNWHKIMKLSSSQPLSQSTVDQVFCNVIAPYVPCVPRNTSQRLIDALTEKELEQLCCPGCKDRFLLPTSFFQHIYRKSARITFNCGPCGNSSLAFYNRCHLRIHVLSHLEERQSLPFWISKFIFFTFCL